MNDYSRPQGNPRFDAENLFARGDVDSTEITPTTETFNDRSVTYFEGDEGRVYDDFEQSSSFYITPIDFDLTSQISRNHQFKLGFDLQLHRLRYFRHLTPTLTYRGPYEDADNRGGFQDTDRYGYQYDWNNEVLEPLDSTRGRQKATHLGVVLRAGQDGVRRVDHQCRVALRLFECAHGCVVRRERALGGRLHAGSAGLGRQQRVPQTQPALGRWVFR